MFRLVFGFWRNISEEGVLGIYFRGSGVDFSFLENFRFFIENFGKERGFFSG